MEITSRLKEEIKGAKNIGELRDKIVTSLRNIHSEKGKIGYVIGILTSDGPDKIKANVERLKKHTKKISVENDFPIFSAMVTFGGDGEDIVDHIGDKHYKPEKWLNLWRKVLESGYITDLFVTPGWEKSVGANDEHETAKRLGLTIHYVQGD